MAVKNSQSALRVLLALERIVTTQPIGVSALAKLIDADRSATQRAIQTLADAGWIVPAAGPGAQWELSTRLFMLAQLPGSGAALRRRAHGTLEALAAQTGESVFLAIPDAEGFIVIDVVESAHALRVAPRLGQIIMARNTATGRAVLPYLDAERQAALIGYAPDAVQLADFAATRERGYSVSAGEVTPNTTNVATAILDGQNAPVAALAVCAPSLRLGPERFSEVGGLVAAAALRLADGY